MSPLHSGAATLPKGFRYDGDPRTPEPSAPEDEATPPSAPRPRLRLKRRNVSSHLHAPTQQFLASVAAADVPIPSVEEPDFATADEEMMDSLPEIHLQDYSSTGVYERLHARAFSPPKTPAVDLAPSLPKTEFPNWSTESPWSHSDLESSPEYESSRPSTAFSTQTSASLFSQFSHPSEYGDCISPDLDSADWKKLEPHNEEHVSSRRVRSRKAPWTKAMSDHLWSTYMLYLQDPRITPIRLGKSCIPPEGVCNRVAREARRSWKGAPTMDAKSGSSTPTAESSKPFMQWPHTCAATRTRLRELCRIQATSKPVRSSYMSQSPTPFSRAANRRWNRRSTPARSPSVFSGQDMAMSLALSTSETMQPHGPLAQLTRSSAPERPVLLSPMSDSEMDSLGSKDAPVTDRTGLGSPFLAKSYGPSSSSTALASGIDMRQQSQTVGPRKVLMSPVRLTRSRSGTQKRRSIKLEDPPRKRRPSLAAALWGPPQSSESDGQSHVENGRQFSPTDSAKDDELFVPRALGPLADPFVSNEPMSPLLVVQSSASLAPGTQPARLGSPFSMSGSSHSFPNRFSQPVNFSLAGITRPFATVQETTDPSSARPSITSRLAYIDQALKEFRSRGIARRCSQSPP